MTRRLVPIALALVCFAALVPATGAGATVVGTIPFAGGTDLDFDGDLAFVGSLSSSQGGLRIVDISDPRSPELLGFLPCPGNQNDVGVLGGGYVVMAMHGASSGPGCFHQGGRGGLRFVDVRDPRNPEQVSWLTIVGGGVHTVTVVGRTGYLYANPGGLSTSAQGQSTVIVDASDPENPRVAGSFRPPASLGCHDINVNADATRAYCAGSNVTQIWDITDPLQPQVLGSVHNPAIFFHHSAVPSPDGDTLIISDEAFGAHVCDPTGRNPTGAYWFYDISIETVPVLRGWLSQTEMATAGAFVTDWCTAHNFNIVPGKDVMVAAAYTGGTSVIDFSDPALPTVIATVIPPGADTWSSYYHRGFIYTGDLGRGFDVIEVPGL